MLLSVVVTIVDGGETLSRCLAALISQIDAPQMEVIVPYDDTVTGLSPIMSRFETVGFLSLGRLPAAAPKTSHGGQHELFDRRRAAGLRAAHGDIVAILEDRGVPRRDWAAAVVRVHRELTHAVIGGAIENGVDRILNWAVYFCDFGRYQLPFMAGPRAYVSDVNVSYKRHALDQTVSLWRDRYHEPVVHGALVFRGETLFLSPELVVDQTRVNLRLGELIRERFAWGRLFGRLRVREIGRWQRLALVLATPILPALLMFRLARDRMTKRRFVARFALASPLVLLLLAAWSAGEGAAYAAPGRVLTR
jgi:hypothetical protein